MNSCMFILEGVGQHIAPHRGRCLGLRWFHERRGCLRVNERPAMEEKMHLVPLRTDSTLDHNYGSMWIENLSRLIAHLLPCIKTTSRPWGMIL